MIASKSVVASVLALCATDLEATIVSFPAAT
jgi:hypothetical protein